MRTMTALSDPADETTLQCVVGFSLIAITNVVTFAAA